MNLVAEYLLSHKGFNIPLNVSLERTCAEAGIKAAVNNKLLCIVRDFERNLFVLEPFYEGSRQQVDNAEYLLLSVGLVE